MTDAFTIKICGLSTPQTLDAAIAAGADMVGLVFHPKSPRYVTMATAKSLAEQARGRAEIVALTVDWTPEQALELVEALSPDLMQLHGRETPEQVAAVAAATRRPVMKAIGISSASDLSALRGFSEIGARLLLDAKAPKDAAYPGGHGRPFDWTLLAELDPGLSFMLGAGLIRLMSQRPSPSRGRPASMSPQASKARLASRMSAGSRHSSERPAKPLLRL